MVTIRNFKEEDFQLILDWWRDKPAKPFRDLITDTTYIAEVDSIPVGSVSLYLTNCKYACWLENLVVSPEIPTIKRREVVNTLFRHVEEEAKHLGYKCMCLFVFHDGLKRRYQELGYQPTQDNMTSFSKIL